MNEEVDRPDTLMSEGCRTDAHRITKADGRKAGGRSPPEGRLRLVMLGDISRCHEVDRIRQSRRLHAFSSSKAGSTSMLRSSSRTYSHATLLTTAKPGRVSDQLKTACG